MKFLLSFLTIFVMLLTFSIKLQAGFGFLKMPKGGRLTALGNSAAAVGDQQSIIGNPAWLADFSDSEWGLMLNSAWADFKQTNIYGRFPVKKITNACFFSYESFGNIGYYPDYPTQEPLATFKAYSIQARYGIGFKTSANWYLGISSQWNFQRIYQNSAQAISFDLGVGYLLFANPHWRLGGLIQNFGFIIHDLGTKTSLPIAYTIGLSHDIDLSDDWHGLLAVHSGKSDGESFYSVGAEIGYTRFLYLLAGYQSRHDFYQNYSLGFQLAWRSYRFIYTALPAREGLSDFTSVTLSRTF